MPSFPALIVLAACVAQTHTGAGPLHSSSSLRSVKPISRIALLPLDSRPACTQMPVMMAQIAGITVLTPPEDLLGVFVTPGRCEELARWLDEVSTSDLDAIIVSADMLCYGGLVPSRTEAVSLQTAMQRLEQLRTIHEKRPDLPLYVFSAIMRTAPTATCETAPWRMELAKYLYYRDRYRATGSRGAAAKAKEHLSKVPKGELARYERTRKRNAQVQRRLIELLKEGIVDFLILGQDDT